MVTEGGRLASGTALQRAFASLVGIVRVRWADIVAVVFLATAFVALFEPMLKEPTGTDDNSYFDYAGGTLAGAKHHRQRFALLGSAWLAQNLFDSPETAFYAVPFFYGMGLILVSYALSRQFMGVLFAFVTALMVLGLPDFLGNMTYLLPDVPVQFWLVLGLTLFLKSLTAHSPRLPWGWIAASALCFFLAAATKESAATTLIGLVCFPLAHLKSKRMWLILAAVGGAVLALELLQSLVLWAVFGDPLHRIHAVTSGHVPNIQKYVRTPGKMPDDIDWAHLATRFLDQTAEHKSYQAGFVSGLGLWRVLFVSLPFALLVAAWKRDRFLLAFAGFVLGAYITLTFTVISLDPLVPMVRTKGRYFLVVVTLLPVLVMAGWWRALEWPLKRPAPAQWVWVRRGLIVLVCTLYSGTAFAAGRHAFRHERTIRNGDARVADIGKAVARAMAGRGPIERMLGPKKIRGATLTWGQHFEIVGRVWRHLQRRKLRKHDLVLAERDPAALASSQDLMWQRVGHTRYGDLHYVTAWNEPHEAGRYNLLAATKRKLKGKASPRFRLRLEMRTDGAKPTLLKVIAHKNDKPTVVQKLRWERKGKHYVLDATSAPIKMRVDRVTLELATKGRGTFQLVEREISVVDSTHAERE